VQFFGVAAMKTEAYYSPHYLESSTNLFIVEHGDILNGNKFC